MFKRAISEIVSMAYKALGAAVITEVTSILAELWHRIH